MSELRIPRGAVVVREMLAHGYSEFPSLVIPGRDKQVSARDRKSHVGVVIAMGPHRQTKKGVEVDPGFVVGDVVTWHWETHEKSWTRPWPPDGEDACWLPTDCIDGVVG